MEFDAFSAGVELGGLHSKKEIKILFCYILKVIPEGLKKDDLIAALQTGGMVNYFSAAEVFEEMIQTDAVNQTGGIFKLTESGKIIANEFENALPVYVKDNAVLAIKLYTQRIKNSQENRAQIRKIRNGYQVECQISGGDFDLLSMNVFAPDESSALTVKENFYKDPAKVYDAVLAALTGDGEE